MTIKLTREEAIQDLEAIKSFERYARGRLALDIAIEALKHEQLDEWCTDCKEYDTEKKCCPRFNRVIRGAMNREPSEDGTLEVKVEDATKIGRALISDDKHRGGLYYPDEDEPKGDLISRADAIEAMGEEPPVWCDEEYEIAERNQWRADIEAIKSVPSADRPRDGDLISRADAIETIEMVDWYHQNNNKDMVHGANDDEHQAWYKADDVYKALEAVPSAEAVPQSEQYKKGFEDAKRAFLVEYARESQNMRKRIAQLEVMLNAQKAISADRPRGEWVHTPNGIDRDFVWWTCSECGHKIFSETEKDRIEFHAYCGRCGADMRSE